MTKERLTLPATLWSTPTGPWPEPPVQTRPALLPTGELTPENAERLFARLLETEAHVEHATLFGLPGQAQAGIDVYARMTTSLGDTGSAQRSFVALQSRRVKSLTAASITSAVRDFLAGEWAHRCSRFYYATSSSLRDTKLDAAVRSARGLLGQRNIEFEPWGAEELAERLRGQPRLVDDFFGRGWVKAFCGEDRAAELARRIPPEQARAARAALGGLYRAAFRAQGASPTAVGTHKRGLSYLILDTEPVVGDEIPRTAAELEWTESAVPMQPPEEFAGAPRIARLHSPQRPRRDPVKSADREALRIPADEWAESARLRLLIGAPGSGKSSFLMFAAVDILATEPQSAALQRAHGGHLPLWLPFGFLCRHLEESTTNSIESAIHAWVTQQGGHSAWNLTQPALDDERAVLLVDGADEWRDFASAEYALGLIESFVSQRQIGAILTARPYAVDRLNWVEPWSKAVLAPLTHVQQIDLVTRVLSESDTIGMDESLGPHAGSFLAELSQISALNSLLATPLFLGLLAKSWRGESLPPQRLNLFSALVQLLVDKHPQMRRRASSAAGSEFSTADMLTVLRGVAYRSRIDGGSTVRTRQEMERWFRQELRREDGLAYLPSDAARVATAVLSQAEDEYGLLVPQGAGTVGFLHRILLDQLAGEYLATLPPDLQEGTLIDRAGDPSWRDVLIAALATQINAHVNTSLLTRLREDPNTDPLDAYELIAEAIAASVAITTQQQSRWVAEIIGRVDEHTDDSHRTKLLTSLVSMTRYASLRPLLLSTFARWLSAAHPEPTSPLWMLRDLAIAEPRVLPALLWGLRHESEAVQLNAAHAIAIRYRGDATIGFEIETRIRQGSKAINQAFALLCLGTGWPNWPELPALLEWARAQVTPELRVCAAHLLREAVDGEFGFLADEEKQWFGGFVRHEGLRPREHWKDLAVPFVQHVMSQQPEAARFVLETLSSNGETGGDRSMAWLLACTTFSNEVAIKNWVADELRHPDRSGLILYNLALIPDSWRADPDFAMSAIQTIQDEVSRPSMNDGAVTLANSLQDDEALAVLLPALDSWRPVRVGAALLQRFGARPEVQTAFETRLRGPIRSAAALAPLALEALGSAEGFQVLVALLRSSADEGDREERVLVAMAVADAWAEFISKPDSPEFAAIVAEYDPNELATLCTAVGTGHLTWHVGPIIAAWPEHKAVVEFAMQALRHPGHISSGVHDPAPPAIVRVYGARAGATAHMMFEAVLDQLAYLPPQLREVLVDALTRSDLTPATLRDLLGSWTDDPDMWVQRAALTGMIRRVERYRISPNAELAQTEESIDWLRTHIQAELRGYGPALEDRRQNGWVGMLLLGELGLHDELRETIGEPTRPGVHLRHLFGTVDRELVDLLSTKWDDVFGHFGDGVFGLLSAANARDIRESARASVLGQLSTGSALHPSVSQLIRSEADVNSQFRNSAEYLLWLHRGGRRDLDLFLACLSSEYSFTSTLRETPDVYNLLVDPDAWQIPADTLRDAITEQPGFDSTPRLRALFCELFPTDDRSGSMFAELEAWFRADEPRERREWIDTLAIAVRASPSPALPVIAERAHQQIRVRDAGDLFPLLTGPLVRRLRSDPHAATAVRSVIQDPESVDTSTSVWALATEERVIRDAAIDTQLSYLLAVGLARSGLLDNTTLTSARRLLAMNPDVVVHDPFTGVERSARAALVALSMGRTHG